MSKKPAVEMDPEITAINDVYAALKALDLDAQTRVLGYVAGKLKIPTLASKMESDPVIRKSEEVDTRIERERIPESTDSEVDDLDGISPVAKKWMARNGLNTKQLSTIFSLGVDEIDLVAKKVPGKTNKERMQNVFLLKGVAAYLGTGAARFTHEQIKEACLHYDAYDASNFAAYFKSLASEIAGNKETGYTLTARGLANATEAIKSIVTGGTN